MPSPVAKNQTAVCNVVAAHGRNLAGANWTSCSDSLRETCKNLSAAAISRRCLLLSVIRSPSSRLRCAIAAAFWHHAFPAHRALRSASPNENYRVSAFQVFALERVEQIR